MSKFWKIFIPLIILAVVGVYLYLYSQENQSIATPKVQPAVTNQSAATSSTTPTVNSNPSPATGDITKDTDSIISEADIDQAQFEQEAADSTLIKSESIDINNLATIYNETEL